MPCAKSVVASVVASVAVERFGSSVMPLLVVLSGLVAVGARVHEVEAGLGKPGERPVGHGRGVGTREENTTRSPARSPGARTSRTRMSLEVLNWPVSVTRSRRTTGRGQE